MSGPNCHICHGNPKTNQYCSRCGPEKGATVNAIEQIIDEFYNLHHCKDNNERTELARKQLAALMQCREACKIRRVITISSIVFAADAAATEAGI